MPPCAPHPEGVLLTVRAQPGARRNALRGIERGALKLAVTQAAEKGKANQALITLLCEALALRRSQVTLVRGATSADKQFLIRGIDEAEMTRRLSAVRARDR